MQRTISASARHIATTGDDITAGRMPRMTTRELKLVRNDASLTHALRAAADDELRRRDPIAHNAKVKATNAHLATFLAAF
jgi:hypothetical protein